jgi:hypothetical protein
MTTVGIAPGEPREFGTLLGLTLNEVFDAFCFIGGMIGNAPNRTDIHQGIFLSSLKQKPISPLQMNKDAELCPVFLAISCTR